MNESDSTHYLDNQEVFTIEVWIVQSRGGIELLATNTDKSNLAYFVDELYAILIAQSKLPHLKE